MGIFVICDDEYPFGYVKTHKEAYEYLLSIIKERGEHSASYKNNEMKDDIAELKESYKEFCDNKDADSFGCGFGVPILEISAVYVEEFNT